MEFAARPRATTENSSRAVEGLVEELYDRHARRIYNLARRFAGDAVEAEDLTQEVFLRVLTRAHTLETDRDPTPWITRVAVRVFLNRKRRRPGPRSLEREPIAPSSGPRSDAIEAASRLLGRLPAKQRFFFLLVHYESRTAREAAALTGVKLNTVRSHLKRARRTLKELLERTSPRELP